MSVHGSACVTDSPATQRSTASESTALTPVWQFTSPQTGGRFVLIAGQPAPCVTDRPATQRSSASESTAFTPPRHVTSPWTSVPGGGVGPGVGVTPGGGVTVPATTPSHRENSEVLPALSVAVAVTAEPNGVWKAKITLKLASPPPSVVTLTVPR